MKYKSTGAWTYGESGICTPLYKDSSITRRPPWSDCSAERALLFQVRDERQRWSVIDILLVIQEGDGLPANNYSMECLDRQSSISGNSPTSTRTREHTLWALELVVTRVHVLEKCARGSLLGLSLFHSSDHIQQIAALIKVFLPYSSEISYRECRRKNICVPVRRTCKCLVHEWIKKYKLISALW